MKVAAVDNLLEQRSFVHPEYVVALQVQCAKVKALAEQLMDSRYDISLRGRNWLEAERQVLQALNDGPKLTLTFFKSVESPSFQDEPWI